MCGVFGMMGPAINQRDLEIIKDLGVVSQLRGLDGAGIFQIRSNPTHNYSNYEKLYKVDTSFSDLLNDCVYFKKDLNTLLDTVLVDVVIGHVRAATRGIVSRENSHPYSFSNIVGAHNGTLKDFKYMDKNKTDSELLFQDINENGIVPVIEKLDKDSAYTLTIYDRENKEMVFLRNELRPLAFAVLKSRQVIYWASERDMLKYVLDRHGQDYKVVLLNPNVLLRIKPSSMLNLEKYKEDPLSVMKGVSVNRPVPTIIQRARDEEERKKKEEEQKKKREEEQKAREENKTSGWTEPKTSSEVLKIPSMPGNSNVLPMTSGRRFDATSHYKSCECGSVSLNIVAANRVRQGFNDKVKWNKSTDTYHCDLCDSKEKKEVVNV